jgi:hypothetical protein
MNQHVPPPGPPAAVPPPQGVDVPRAQADAINCLIDIIDEPYTGYDLADYDLSRAVIKTCAHRLHTTSRRKNADRIKVRRVPERALGAE